MKKVLLAVLLLQSMVVFSQDKKTKKKDAAKTENEAKKDSTAKGNTTAYDDFIKGAVTKDGLFKIHTIKEKIYFEIPNEVLGKDLLIVNKISSVPAQINNAGINKGINYENKLDRKSVV